MVTCVGQPIGIVTACNRDIALQGARAVVITYEEVPAILTIEEAIEKGSEYTGWGHSVEDGDVDAVLMEPDLVTVEGIVRAGGQEHFYLEPNAHLVVPGEFGEIVSYSSTQVMPHICSSLSMLYTKPLWLNNCKIFMQCPDKHQKYISHCLNIPEHKVVVRTKRIGGGFGGKETRAAFVNAAAAIPALLLNRPVSLVLDRSVDMSITGHRHPFLVKYKACCTKGGKIKGCDLAFYCNAGNSLDLSHSVMDRALISSDCVYKIENFRAKGVVCKTNLPSNTAFRGFGGPQGMFAMESIVDHMSKAISMDVHKFKILNMYEEGDVTPYGMVLEGCQARRCWKEAIESAGGLESRMMNVDVFNAKNRFRKRGLAVTPTKFGISFTSKFLNQAGALVHIYKDGTIFHR